MKIVCKSITSISRTFLNNKLDICYLSIGIDNPALRSKITEEFRKMMIIEVDKKLSYFVFETVRTRIELIRAFDVVLTGKFKLVKDLDYSFKFTKEALDAS